MKRAAPSDPPVRILHIVGGSAFGGGSMVILDLVQSAVSHGHEVSVLTTEPLLSARTRALGGRVIDVNAIERRLHPWYDVRGLVRLVQVLRRHPFDVVHTHTSKAGVLGRLAAFVTRVPVVVHTMHGMAVHDRSPRWAIRATAAVEKLMAFCAHRVVTVSQWHRTWALLLGISHEGKLLAIPNGVRRDRTPTRSVEAIRRELQVASYECLVLCVSRIADGKGLEDLVHAMSLLRTMAPARATALRIAGTGATLDVLRTVVQEAGFDADRVLIGHRDDVDDLLAAADVVVHPSHREGLSLALLESMMAGCALVASAIPTALEATENGEAAWLYEPGNAPALANALHRAIHDPRGSAQRRQSALRRAREEYSVCTMQDRYDVVYNRLLLERTGRLVVPTGDVQVGAVDARDIPTLVALHRSAFPGFFLTSLGDGVLAQYYRCALDAPGGILRLATVGGVPVGFVCGSSQPAALMRTLLKRAPYIGLALLRECLRRPSLLVSLIGRIAGRTRDVVLAATVPAAHANDAVANTGAELTSIAVHPRAGGRGIGQHLVIAFGKVAAAKGSTVVHLTTDSVDNSRVQTFYERLGFERTGTLQRGHNRSMCAYQIRVNDLCPAEPQSGVRHDDAARSAA